MLGENFRKGLAKALDAFGHGYAAVEHEGADLIYCGRAFADKPCPHPMQGLQIELLHSFGCHKAHGGPLHGLCIRFGIAVIVLVALEEGLHIFGWHQPGIMPKRDQPAQGNRI